MTARLLFIVSALIGASLLGGCSTCYSYSFTPALAEHTIELEDARPRQAVRTFVSIIGVRRADAGENTPPAVEVRFRIDNGSDVEARIEPSTLQLVSADMMRFDEARIVEGETTIAPRSSATFTAWFPFPDGSSVLRTDLDGLNVSWWLEVGDDRRAQSAAFSKRERVYRAYPHYGPYHSHPRYWHGTWSYHYFFHH
ncbi:MAG: hypothetical protein SYC29_10435 [Planctomycetota bacterium]|nr:hypothetical protein [Planctomycetota bacterium]